MEAGSVLSKGGKCANLIVFLWLVYGEKLRGGFGRQGGGHCIVHACDHGGCNRMEPRRWVRFWMYFEGRDHTFSNRFDIGK